MHYGVLVGVSTGYPPVAGRLHTRYAPVRRSPAAHCWAPLPLDLHVLSLPLAFILSQDQTLHCKNCLLSTFDSSRVSASGPPPEGLRHTLSHLPNRFNVLLPPGSLAFSLPLPLSKAGAKIQPFSKPPKFFFAFSETFFAPLFEPARCGRNFFSKIAETDQKHAANREKNAVFSKNRHSLTRGKQNIAATCCYTLV